MYYEDEIFGFAYGCPLKKRDMNCPFNGIDHLSFNEKVNWIKSLSDEKKKLVIEHHLFCTKHRK